MNLILLTLVLSLNSSCKVQYPDLGDGLYAEFVTTKDTIVVKLTPEKTPVTVANFVALAEGKHPMVSDQYKGKPYYNGLTFHRVMKNFMIQGGDPLANGSGDPGYKFGDEFDDTLKHDKAGVLSMANSGPSTNGSQFFITHNATPWLDGVHTVFGQTVIGQDVVNAIVQGDTIIQLNIIRQGMTAKGFDAVKTWESELPKLEERNKQRKEELRKKKEEAKRLREEKITAAAKAFMPTLDEYASKAKATASGLKLYTIKKGTGIKPKTGQTAKVNYHGYYTDGKLFDSNLRAVEEKYGMYNQQKDQRQGYSPLSLKISPDVPAIAGFKEAAASMRVGDEIYVYIPSHLGYGERGRGMIKPNTDLIFIMEMVGMQ